MSNARLPRGIFLLGLNPQNFAHFNVSPWLAAQEPCQMVSCQLTSCVFISTEELLLGFRESQLGVPIGIIPGGFSVSLDDSYFQNSAVSSVSSLLYWLR